MGKDSLFVLVIWEKCIGSLTKRTLCNTTLRQFIWLVSSLSLKKHTQPDFIRNWTRKHQMYFRNLNMRSMFTIIHGHGLYWIFNQLMSMVFVFIFKRRGWRWDLLVVSRFLWNFLGIPSFAELEKIGPRDARAISQRVCASLGQLDYYETDFIGARNVAQLKQMESLQLLRLPF